METRSRSHNGGPSRAGAPSVRLCPHGRPGTGEVLRAELVDIPPWILEGVIRERSRRFDASDTRRLGTWMPVLLNLRERIEKEYEMI